MYHCGTINPWMGVNGINQTMDKPINETKITKVPVVEEPGPVLGCGF